MKREYINPQITVYEFAGKLMQDDYITFSMNNQDVDSDDVLGKGNDFDFDSGSDYSGFENFVPWED